MPSTSHNRSWRMEIVAACFALALFAMLMVVIIPIFIKRAAYPCDDAQFPSECEALFALYFHTGGADWTDNTGWLGDDNVCRWIGVGCDGDWRVIEINLQYNNLSGQIPLEISNLSNLQALVLNGNALVSLPPEIGNLSNLQWLYVHENELTSLPPEIGNLSNLELLNLSGNLLTCVPEGVAHLVNDLPVCEE